MVPSCSRLWSTSSSICKETNHVKGKKKSGTDKISYSQGSKKSKARVTCYISLPHLHILHVENCRHTYIMKKSSWSSQSCCLMRQQGKKKTKLISFWSWDSVTSGIQLKVLRQMPNSEQLEVTRQRKKNPKTLQGYHKSVLCFRAPCFLKSRTGDVQISPSWFLCLQFIFSIFCLNTLKTFHCGCCKGIPAQKMFCGGNYYKPCYLKMQKSLAF